MESTKKNLFSLEAFIQIFTLLMIYVMYDCMYKSRAMICHSAYRATTHKDRKPYIKFYH